MKNTSRSRTGRAAAPLAVRASSVTIVPAGSAGEDPLVERAVHDLRGLVAGGKVRILIEAGEYIIKNFYGGEAQARSKAPNKAASLARLRERAAEFGMTAADLPRAVGVALQVQDIGRRLALRLRQEHHLALLPLRDAEEKKMLAETTVEENWTAQHLKRKVAELRERHPGGRPRQPAIAVFVRRLEKLLDAVEAPKLLASRHEMEADERRNVETSLRAAEARLARLREALRG